MTAEIVIMNRTAVALAADSALTIGEGPKIFNSAEKVFMLIPHKAIGFMIYNDADFMGMPWETIVKKYRDHFARSKSQFGTLNEYADDFISFLSTCENSLIDEK